MGKNLKVWVLVLVRVLCKVGSVRVRVLCLPSKVGFGFGSGSSKSRVLVRFFKNRFGFFPISNFDVLFSDLQSDSFYHVEILRN